MRLFTAVCATLLFSVLAFGQRPMVRAYPGYNGYGPYVPMVTTPEVSLDQISPNSVGASDATYGLQAGARNSTLSMMDGNTSSTFTEPVWYSGGTAPYISTPEVSLNVRGVHGRGMFQPGQMREMEEHARAEAGPRPWTYFASVEETSSAADAAQEAKSGKRATRTITNADIDQENQKTGTVKYDGKTEKIQ
ncbi:MAG TPA: hypothetical protein VF133_17390 [Terriglobales bacterium]